MTSNPEPPKRSAPKKKIKNEEPQTQIIKVEPPESKLKRLSDEQYKKRLEDQFTERQERKKQEEEEERKKREEEETVKNADLVEYAPGLPEITNGQTMPEMAFKFVMEIMPQLLEELERLKRYKGTKKNIHLKIPNGFNFD